MQIDKETHIQRIRMGDMANNFLESSEWKDIVKPIIDSMRAGAASVLDIDFDDDKSAMVEIKYRKQLVNSLDAIEKFIRQFVEDGDVSKKILDKGSNVSEEEQPIVKIKE